MHVYTLKLSEDVFVNENEIREGGKNDLLSRKISKK
jgi:hypothetical protein